MAGNDKDFKDHAATYRAFTGMVKWGIPVVVLFTLAIMHFTKAL